MASGAGGEPVVGATAAGSQSGAVAAGGRRRRGLGWLWLLLVLLLALAGLILWLVLRNGGGPAAGAAATTSPSGSVAAVVPGAGSVTASGKSVPAAGGVGDASALPTVPPADAPSAPATPAAGTSAVPPTTPSAGENGSGPGTALIGGGPVPVRPITGSQPGQLGTVLFPSGAATLDARSRQVLAAAAARIKAANPSSVTVAGFTNAVGTRAANTELSRRRADAVATALRADLGAAGPTVIVAGVGEQDPATTNATAAGRQANRRVTITSPGVALIGGGGVPVHPATGSAALPPDGIGVTLFDVDSAVVNAAGRTVLSDTAARIRAARPAMVTVAGYASEPGTARYNLALSGRRAEAVAAILRSQLGSGAPPIAVRGLGEQPQVASSATAAGRQLNRRAVVTTG